MAYWKFIVYISYIPILVATILAIYYYKKYDIILKSFSQFILVSAIAQVISLGFFVFKLNNMPILHIYTLIGFVYLAAFYRAILKDYINIRIVWIVTILFSLFTILNSLFLQNFFSFNSYALTIQSVLIIIISLFTYIVLFNNIVEKKHITSVSGINWINSGLFIYHSCCLILFFIGDSVIVLLSKEYYIHTWVFHSFLSMLIYCFFIVGLWRKSSI
jgi:hypothetical protein